MSFSPPGWTVEVAALAVGIAGALLWSLAEVVVRRRPGRARETASSPAG
ncbi:Uncharacterised protein [Mycobacteroides abscessus]|nr:Uncharacterised protein [Mycobacteroides abscessus]